MGKFDRSKTSEQTRDELQSSLRTRVNDVLNLVDRLPSKIKVYELDLEPSKTAKWFEINGLDIPEQIPSSRLQIVENMNGDTFRWIELQISDDESTKAYRLRVPETGDVANGEITFYTNYANKSLGEFYVGCDVLEFLRDALEIGEPKATAIDMSSY